MKSAQKVILYCLCMLVLSLSTASLQSCSRKSGCPTNEITKNKTKVKRNGDLSMKKGSSQLFPKKMRRRGK